MWPDDFEFDLSGINDAFSGGGGGDWGGFDLGFGGDGFDNFNWMPQDLPLPATIGLGANPMADLGVDAMPRGDMIFSDPWATSPTEDFYDPMGAPRGGQLQGIDSFGPSNDPSEFFMNELPDGQPELQDTVAKMTPQEYADRVFARGEFAGPGAVGPKMTADYPYGATDAKDLANRYLEMSGGDLQRANGLAMAYRTGQYENDPMFRDAQHYLLSQQYIRDYPGLGVATAAPIAGGYSLAKAGAQALPAPAGANIDRVMRLLGLDPLYNASQPSLSEFYWGGVRPVMEGLGFTR